MTLQWMDEVFPVPEHENRDIWKEYLPRAQFILDSRVNFNENERSKQSLLSKVGKGLWILGKYMEAENMFRQALALTNKGLNTLLQMYGWMLELVDKMLGRSIHRRLAP